MKKIFLIIMSIVLSVSGIIVYATTTHYINKVNLNITEETALTIADSIFLQIYGEESLNNTIVDIKETENQTCFLVRRHHEGYMLGGDHSIIIRKSDGKIMRMISGK